MWGACHKGKQVQVDLSSTLASIFFAYIPKPSRKIEARDFKKSHGQSIFTAKDTEAPKEILMGRKVTEYVGGRTGKCFASRQHRTSPYGVGYPPLP